VLLSRAVSLVGVAVALAGPVVAQAPPGSVDLVPMLTSAPFGAVGGQSVTHTILISSNGTAGNGSAGASTAGAAIGSVTGVRVTFTTTVGLDGIVANTSQGHCAVVDQRTVTCDLGVVDFPTADAAPPKITISGTVTPGSVRGTLVQNLVKVTSETSDSDLSNNVASNAYLIPGPSDSPASRPTVARSSRGTARRSGYLVPAAAGVLVLGALVSVILLRRRRR
jgi:hypothetical protein